MASILTVEAARRRALALELVQAGLEAVQPHRCVPQCLRRLRARGVALEGATVFAFGKAAAGMAEVVVDELGVKRGIVVAPELTRCGELSVRRGGHPLPAPDAPEIGAEVLALARALGPTDTALCLVSGGGSAMLELPRPGISLSEIADVTHALLRAGADIVALNAVRARLSALKGGGLAAAIAPARVVNVVLSDVPGHPPELVASGPTSPLPRGPDPVAIVARYGVRLSSAAEAALRAVPPSACAEIITELAADNATARRAIVGAARERGVELEDRGESLSGEARVVGAKLAEERRARGYVWGGETSVRVRGSGRGGRNQELVLGALAAGWRAGLFLSVGSDGVDGASGAAGGFVDPPLVEHVAALGLDPWAALTDNDSAPFFEQAGAAIVTGPTGTNVADLAIFLP